MAGGCDRADRRFAVLRLRAGGSLDDTANAGADRRPVLERRDPILHSHDVLLAHRVRTARATTGMRAMSSSAVKARPGDQADHPTFELGRRLERGGQKSRIDVHL